MLRYALAFCAVLFAGSVQAADLPDRPIRIIVPSPRLAPATSWRAFWPTRRRPSCRAGP